MKIPGKDGTRSPGGAAEPGVARSTRVLFWAGAIALMAQLALVLWARILPFPDTPHHLAAGTVMRYMGESGNLFQGFYALPELGPNLLHLWFISSALFPSVEFANKLAYLLAFAGLPLASIWAIRSLGGAPVFGWLALLFIYNFSSLWGFAGYTIGLPITIALLAIAAGFWDEPRLGRGSLLAAGLLLLFLAHGQLAMFMVAVLGTAWAAHAVLERRFSFDRLWPIAPLVLLILVWVATTPPGESGSVVEVVTGYYSSEYVGSFRDRVTLPFYDLSSLIQGPLGYLFGLVLVAPLAVPFLGSGRPDLRRVWEATTSARMLPVSVFSIASLGAWFLLPSYLPDQAFVFERFGILVMLAAVLVGGVALAAKPGLVRWIAPLGVVAFALQFAADSSFYREFGEASADFTPAVLPPDNTSRVAAVTCDPYVRQRPAVIHLINYHIVWHQGIAATALTDLRFGSIRRPEGSTALPDARPWFCYEREYDGRFDDLEYLLVQDPSPLEFQVPQGFVPAVTEGDWTLYQNVDPAEPAGVGGR